MAIRELAEKIRKLTGYKGKIQWNSFPKRSLEIPKLEVDNSKAKKLLKWKPKYTLDYLCKDMLESDLKLYGMTLDDAKKISKRLKKK